MRMDGNLVMNTHHYKRCKTKNETICALCVWGNSLWGRVLLTSTRYFSDHSASDSRYIVMHEILLRVWFLNEGPHALTRSYKTTSLPHQWAGNQDSAFLPVFPRMPGGRRCPVVRPQNVHITLIRPGIRQSWLHCASCATRDTAAILMFPDTFNDEHVLCPVLKQHMT